MIYFCVTLFRLIRSKDVKLKGVSGAQDSSEVGMKGPQSDKVLKKGRATWGGGNKGCGIDDANGHQVSTRGGTQEVGVIHGG